MSATTAKTFNSKVKILSEFAKTISAEKIKTEPLVFDSRVHMLMPGWYPAIPGWHHDDVPRASIPTGQHFIIAGQPDYETPRYKAEHIMGLVNADICPTKFAIGECNMKLVKEI